MRTTQHYLHLAGVVFLDEATRLEDRFAPPPLAGPADESVLDSELGTERGTRLTSPQTT